METRVFGKAGMQVSALGFGASEIGPDTISVKTVDALLGVAFEFGINVIDTAECYDESEEKLGRVLGGRRKQCFLFTKCGHAPRLRAAPPPVRVLKKLWRSAGRLTGRFFPDWDPRLLERSIDRSLRRLRTDWLDLIQLHSCSEEILRRGAVIEVLQRARKAGKARYIGYSGDGQAALFAIQSGQFDSLETSVNIADQQALELTLPLASERRLGVIAKRPMANVVWRYQRPPDVPYYSSYWERIQALQYEFLRDGSRAVGVSLRFTLHAPGVHTAIMGTTNPEHFRKNIELAAAGPLDPGELEAIRRRWKEVAGPDWTGQQ